MIAQPLTPPVKVQVADSFVAGKGGIADEPQMRLEIQVRKTRCQSGYPRGQAACAAVRIRTFERDEMKLQLHAYAPELPDWLRQTSSPPRPTTSKCGATETPWPGALYP